MKTSKGNRIILLDYVQTLVENTRENHRRWSDYREWIARERYRRWLVELMRKEQGRGSIVVLITARAEKYEEPTVDRIRRAAWGWMPDEWHFNRLDEAPPKSKRRALEEKIYPVHGAPDETRYIALESNYRTRSMYVSEAIPAIRVPDEGPGWTELPKISGGSRS